MKKISIFIVLLLLSFNNVYAESQIVLGGAGRSSFQEFLFDAIYGKIIREELSPSDVLSWEKNSSGGKDIELKDGETFVLISNNQNSLTWSVVIGIEGDLPPGYGFFWSEKENHFTSIQRILHEAILEQARLFPEQIEDKNFISIENSGNKIIFDCYNGRTLMFSRLSYPNNKKNQYRYMMEYASQD